MMKFRYIYDTEREETQIEYYVYRAIIETFFPTDHVTTDQVAFSYIPASFMVGIMHDVSKKSLKL